MSGTIVKHTRRGRNKEGQVEGDISWARNGGVGGGGGEGGGVTYERSLWGGGGGGVHQWGFLSNECETVTRCPSAPRHLADFLPLALAG